jgi:hypothetical protein
MLGGAKGALPWQQPSRAQARTAFASFAGATAQ